jgi:hypothetical protein
MAFSLFQLIMQRNCQKCDFKKSKETNGNAIGAETAHPPTYQLLTAEGRAQTENRGGGAGGHRNLGIELLPVRGKR